MAVLTPDRSDFFEIGLLSVFQITLFGLLISHSFSLGLFIILLPVLVIATVMSLYRRFEYAAIFLLGSSILFLENVEGVNIIELVYFSIVICLFIAYPGTDMLKGRLSLNTTFDKAALTFTLILGYGVILGFINGGDTTLVLGEILYYFGFLGYFAYRRHIHQLWFQKALLAVFILLLLYVAVRNVYYYREILVAAYAEWQAQKARTAANEVILLTGALGSISFVLYSNKWILKGIGIVLLSVFIFDLVITQSRGYWLAFAFGLFSMWIIAGKQLKLQIMAYSSLLAMLGIVTGYLFFNDLFHLILEGLVNRIESLFSVGAGGLDVSLKERLLESKTVVKKIAQNPVAGYGFGVTFPRYFFMPQVYQDYSYVHNGYLAIWYKLGLPGLIAILWYNWHLLKTSYHLFKKQLNPAANMVFLTMFGTLMGMLLVNHTSPQFLSFDSMLLLGLMGAFCATYYEQYLKPPIKTTDF